MDKADDRISFRNLELKIKYDLPDLKGYKAKLRDGI